MPRSLRHRAFFAAPSVMAAFGWRSLYYTPCALGVLWCGAWLALGADTPHNHPRVSPKELARITGAETSEATAVGSVQRREESAEGWRAMVRSPALWGQIFADFAQNYFFYVVFTFLPQFLSAALGFSPDDASWLTGANIAAGM